ncbi:acylphosphatase-2-like [Watersipora subatra]|uniref:acylphosphatase-2-like n=1 Tax=Watersipora subatra TaxID=2589382 RepID=UPI00355C4950
MATSKLHSFDFEVFGKVQGVFFRRETQKKAAKLGVCGWVMNTQTMTVVGTAQGSKEMLQQMKHWLSKVGSKRSRISKCDIKNERTLSALEFSDFSVRV